MKQFKEDWQLYLLLLPGLLLMFIFKYVPMYGILIAFKDYNPMLGIMGSPWVGMKHFVDFISMPNFAQLMFNTFILSFYGLIFGFVAPVILALALHQVASDKMKQRFQLIFYAPNFISVVIIVGMMMLLFSPVGPINLFLTKHGIDAIPFMTSDNTFRSMYVGSNMWQATGWSSIIYTAALSNVSSELTEAATLDGASMLQRIRYIQWPTIKPIAVILFILAAGSIMSIGYEKAYLMQNSLNMNTAEILPTYLYKEGLQKASYSYSTAVGLFNSVINLTLILFVNKIVKRFNEGEGL